MKINDLMNSKKDVTIGYIGGSVTIGREYTDRFTDYLRKKYPKNNITEINAGVGGTTSFLGVHRSDRDLFSHNPDIVIIEFSINDSADDSIDVSLFGRTMEGLLRKAFNVNRDTLAAVFGITSNPLEKNYFSKGLLPQSHEIHKKVAEYYNVPFINAGAELHLLAQKEDCDINCFFQDGVHPNEKGGKAYCDILVNALDDYNWSINKKSEPLFENNFEKATLLMGENYTNEEWKVSKCTLYGKLPNYIYCNEPGKEVKVDFYGSAIGIYCTSEKDSGILEYSIDGSEWKKISTWDKYCLDSNRAHNYIFDYKLEKKKHKMIIRVANDKDEFSEGRYIRIGAFLGEKE